MQYNLKFILLSISLIEYWTGLTKKKTKVNAVEWLPEVIEVIPVGVWDPRDSEMIIYQGGGGDAA